MILSNYITRKDGVMGRQAKLVNGMDKYGSIVIAYDGIKDLLTIVEALTRMEHEIIEFGANEEILLRESRELRGALESHMLRAHPARIIRERKEAINRLAIKRGFVFRFIAED
jgi:hypothetical protein